MYVTSIRLGILLCIFASLFVTCTSPEGIDSDDGEIIFSRIPLDEINQKAKSNRHNDYYCSVSTLASEEIEFNYLYDSFSVEIPEKIVQRSKGKNKIFERVISAGEEYSLAKAKSFRGKDNVTRVVRCMLPDDEEAFDVVQEWVSYYGKYSWLKDFADDTKSKATGGEFEWVCTQYGSYVIYIYDEETEGWVWATTYGCIEGYWRYIPAEEEIGGGGPGPGGPDPNFDCPDPTIPCDPGGGGGAFSCGVNEVLDPTTGTCVPDINPCEVMDGKENDSNFRNAINRLQSDLNSNDFETGYVIYNRASNPYVYQVGTSGSVNFAIDPNSKTIGIMHNHPQDPDFPASQSAFSATDINTVYKLLLDGKMENPFTFTSSLATYHGTKYTMMISDPAAFQQFGESNFGSILNAATFTVDYEDRVLELTSIHGDVKGAELAMLEVLQGSGVKVFKANSDATSWQGMKAPAPGTTTILIDNCN